MLISTTFQHYQGNMFKKLTNVFSKKISESPTLSSLASIRRDGWQNILTGLGMRGTDKKVSGCFRACPIFSYVECDEMYRADGLTRRIIDIVASEMIRQGWEIEGDPKGNISSKLEELHAYSKLCDLIKWARLYGGAIIVMGIADGRDLSEPVNEYAIRNINWLHVFDRYEAMVDPQCCCVDLNSCNYGNPDYYQVNDVRTGATFIVHYTRVLRMDWSIMPARLKNLNQGWGDSILLSIYEELRNYGTAFSNLSTIMQDFVNGVLKIPNLSQTMASGCADNDIMRRLDFANLSKGVTNMMVLDGDEVFEKLSTNVSGLGDVIDKFMGSVSAVTGIPISLLFGQCVGGLNASGNNEVRNFYDLIKQYQETKLKPVLEKLTYYIMKAQDIAFLGKEPEDWNIQFAPLWQNTEEQEAILRKTVADTDAIYIDRGVLDANEVAISRFGGDRWSMNTIIDIEARKNGFDPNEIADLEYQKEQEIKKMQPEAEIGPADDNYTTNRIYVGV